jgi:hypothetical protein
VCAIEAAEFTSSKLRVADMIAPAVSDAQELAEHMALVDKLTEIVAWNQRAMGRGNMVSGEDEVDARAAVEASAKRLMGLQP